MTGREWRMLSLSRQWLRHYFSDGKTRMPADFDEDFLGGLDIRGTVGLTPLAWNGTPFFTALGFMVQFGEIDYWQDAEGNHYYRKAADG